MSELRWLSDLDAFAAETEDELEEVEQDALHVLEQDRGTNLDDEDRGVGVASILSRAELPGLERIAEKMLEQDERIRGAKATITTAPDGTKSLDVAIDVDGELVPVPVSATYGGDG